MATNTQYWVWLGTSLGYGSHAIKPLLERFGDAEGVFNASPDEFLGIPYLSSAERRLLLTHDLTRAEEVANYAFHGGIRILSIAEEEYPSALREIPNPPTVLYVKGELPDLNRLPCIGVVGARAMSYYGAEAACEISYDLARMGCVTVSGMALGIDGAVAAATLAAGGKTVAVLGSGIDRIYPAEHKALYHAIVDGGGAVITEFPPYEGADGFHFPIRNRIISGLSRAVILVEGEATSGAMITARYAKKHDRSVFAVPGKIGDKNSEAPHLLLKSDAKLLTCADDVYDAFREEYFSTMNPFALLPKVSLHVEAILRDYGVTVGKEKVREKKLLGGEKPSAPKNGVIGKIRSVFGGESKDTRDGDDPRKKSKEEYRARLDSERREILSKTAYAIYEKLNYETPVHPDEIELDSVGADVIVAELVTMEVLGCVVAEAGGHYLKNEKE